MTLGDFSLQAQAYGHARPHYPGEMMDELLVSANIAAGDRVVDIGAGTGIFTALLVERELSVTAIEPNRDMRNIGESIPHVTWIDATFEETTLPDASQDWAVAAQAFHWADVSRALPEIRRILKPGGALTVLWNNRLNDSSPILMHTMQAISKHVPQFDHNYRTQDWAEELLTTGDFTEVTYHRVEHTVCMSQERYLDLWRSHNRLNTQAGPDRFAALLSDVSQHLESLGATDIEIPYACEAWTAR